MQINRTLFNPAVFVYTLCVKFADPRYWVLPFLLVFVPTFGLIATLSYSHVHLTDEMKKMLAIGIHTYTQQPTVYLLFAYLFISDGLAGGKLIAESDTLALLFTRPMTRFCYVLTRYLAAVTGTSILIYSAILSAHLAGLCYGVQTIDIGPLTMASIILTAASWCAMVIFIHSAAPIVAFLTMFILLGCGGVGAIYSQAQQSNNALLQIIKTVCLFVDDWFGDFMPTSIDLATMAAASAFDTYEFSIFVSNIAFYILIAAFALSCREFSYGSD